jgi:hypothetical protein
MARKTAPAEPITLDDSLWERVMEATHGVVAPCFQCGVCSHLPWGMLQDGQSMYG